MDELMEFKDKKTRIAIFHCGFIYSGGGERIVLEEARGLVKRGYDVVVHAPTLNRKKCFPELVKEVGVKTFFPSFIDRLPAKYALRMLAASFFAPLLAVNFRDVDIFVGANQPGAWIAFCMAKVLRKPYIVYLNQPNRIVYPRKVDIEYGWATTVSDYQFLYHFFQFIKPALSFLDRLSITSAQKVLVNGKYIGRIVEDIYQKDCTDVPAGSYAYSSKNLNFDSVYKGKVKIKGRFIAKPYLLITNRHDPQKRFDYVISAMVRVLGEYQDVVLVVPGPFTDHTKVLKNLAKDLGIEAKIIFTGQVDESDLQKLYENACIYCYPSPEEDFGLGPLEAGGWGVPTVAWSYGGPTVTVEHGVTGFLAKPYEVADYAGCVVKLLKNEKLRAKMGKAAWLRTKDIFSWNKHVDEIEKVVQEFV